MWGSCTAELAKLVRRPANWFMLGIAVVLGLTFTYLLPLAGAAGSSSGAPGTDRGLASTMPPNLVGNSIGGLPVFLGAILLVIGVLAVGSEYGWGTWKTVLTQGPSRLTVYSGKLFALAVATLTIVLSGFATGAVTSAIIASSESEPMNWPAFDELVTGIGAGWLIAMTWAALGAVLAIAMRGVALPIGLGLVWLLVIQNLLFGVAAPLLDWVDTLQLALPGANAGSLAASLGASGATPGIGELVGVSQATLVVAGYLVVFAALGGWLLRRRDVL
ncbi:ABC transporter permease [Amycolatopsis umgeniensis]|uniref:ABC-type transport system involved in multi-copper enzyme maturation permease subunit n=1 Tax=Amycolatopsis umgeniensis TaxID=336628 RepID=A0A841B976_9PSEU|nr:ABC transporter permease [Amycolatopsis umgeniensis]MBB5855425.1 ABC-type transport system involved in multi-copper enzyme maturation permease subunit [Amycolatopsis umgeniensis]